METKTTRHAYKSNKAKKIITFFGECGDSQVYPIGGNKK